MSRFRKHLRPEYRWCTKELNRVSDHLRRAAAETDILDSATDVGREDRAQVRLGGRWVTLQNTDGLLLTAYHIGNASDAVDVGRYVRHNEVHELAVRFTASASRHGISNERAGYVVDDCPVPVYAPASGQRDAALFLGPDRDGVPLEVLAVELAESDLLVVHAMRLRRRYLDEYRMVMRWHER